ncbi:hypothetical protein LguiA_010911 [Lonicera macranthoides]
MSTELLEVQPQELKFIFELKKQSSCSIRLINKSNYHVAFKVKTTSPKKYCVRPNTGIIEPKSTCDFTVMMQAQRVIPPDMICKDKFLLQDTVVPAGTADEDITSSMFNKDGGKYVEERKLRVILVSPPHSPVLSPMNGKLNLAPAYEALTLEDQVLSKVENLSPRHTVRERLKDHVLSQVENLSPRHTVTEDVKESKVENGEEVEPAKDAEAAESKTRRDFEELKLVKDIEEMKSKLNELELKLSQAGLTILKLTEERGVAAQEGRILREELAQLSSSSSKREIRRVQVGFPLLFVCMVAIVSVTLGYLLHR